MNAVQPDALFQAIDDKRLGVSASSDSSLCIFCHTTPADEGYASCSSCRAHNLTLDREPGRPKKATPPAPKPVPKKEEVMSEPTTKKPFACDLCENSYNRSQDLGVHRFRAHGIHGPKTSAGRKPEPVPAPVQAVVEHVNALHVDGPDVPCDEACSWAKEGYALPSGPALPAHPDLRFELIHTRLRLIAAVCQAEDVSATTRALITGDLMRVRAIVDELEAERA